VTVSVGQLRPSVVPQAPLAPDRLNPTRFPRPAFLLNPPFSFSTRVANNPWMEEVPSEQRDPDARRSLLQFLEIYRFLTSDALVYLLPTPRNADLQDLVFTANLGVVLEHVPDRNTVVISNFTSPPRKGEARVGKAFFQALGYDAYVAPRHFEGEADLKHLRDNIYIGGYGIRSEIEAYEWMERTFDAKIIKVRLQEPYLYHLDCSVFPITRQKTFVCTEMFEEEEVAEIEKVTDIIDVTVDDCFTGIYNSVRLDNTIMNGSNIHELKAGTEDYVHELHKNRSLEDIAGNLAFDVSYFNLSEYMKGGALLSCMVMHLNRNSYSFSLTT
jgi:N-dimethylarginine dimethylaminohydrolase